MNLDCRAKEGSTLLHAPGRACTPHARPVHAPPCTPRARPCTPVHASTRPCPTLHAPCTPHARPCMPQYTPRARPGHAPCTPLQARARPVHALCTPRARPGHRPCTGRAPFGHTDASLSGQSGFGNGKRHLCYHTEGPPQAPLQSIAEAEAMGRTRPVLARTEAAPCNRSSGGSDVR